MKTQRFHILVQCHCRWLVHSSVHSFIQPLRRLYVCAGAIFSYNCCYFFVNMCCNFSLSLSLSLPSSHCSQFSSCLHFHRTFWAKKYFLYECVWNFSIAASTTRQFDSMYAILSLAAAFFFFICSALTHPFMHTHALFPSFILDECFFSSSSSSNRSIEPSHYLVSVA